MFICMILHGPKGRKEDPRAQKKNVHKFEHEDTYHDEFEAKVMKILCEVGKYNKRMRNVLKDKQENRWIMEKPQERR